VPPFDRCATYDDLVRVPDHLVAEIVEGELHAEPPPPPGVAGSATALAALLLRGPGVGRGLDSWQVLPGPELRLGANVMVPAAAGWRLSRLPELPAESYFSVPPDWVCEIVSSGSAALRARKMYVYAAANVSHAWLIDPVARSLEVRSVEDGRWVVRAIHSGSTVVRAEPFEAMELPLAQLWPR
jgi:hypothetical protein